MRTLGVDYGAVRIGLALTDPTGTVAAPHGTMEARGTRSDARAVAELATREGAELIVVGLPLSLDGKEGPAAARVMQFVLALRRRVRMPVETFDERFTSVAAEQAMRDAGVRARDRRGRVDPVAAALMLGAWLERGKS